MGHHHGNKSGASGYGAQGAARTGRNASARRKIKLEILVFGWIIVLAGAMTFLGPWH